MGPNPQETTDLVNFTEEILNNNFVQCKSSILSALLCFCGYFLADV